MDSTTYTLAEAREDLRRMDKQLQDQAAAHARIVAGLVKKLRDECALAALPAIVRWESTSAVVAKVAYDVADAMIAERERRYGAEL